MYIDEVINAPDLEYQIRRSAELTYEILKNGSISYYVTVSEGKESCSCPGHQYRGICKHTNWVSELLDLSDQKRFDRDEARRSFMILLRVVENLVGTFQYEICGSYRREMKTVRDLDVLIRDDGPGELILAAFSDGFIEKTSFGTKRTIGKIWCDTLKELIQIDIHLCKPEEWGSHLLYFTGSREFNIKMRTHAKKMGYTLNEYGLYHNVTKIASETEQSIFEALKLEYVEPNRRLVV